MRTHITPMKSSEDVLRSINTNYVKIRSNYRKRNNSILCSVLKEFLTIMGNCDPLFRSMKPSIEYLGSYYDRLRVGLPNEFDINVTLKLPVDYNKILINARECRYDHTAIVMPSEFRRLSKNQLTANGGFTKTEIWCDHLHRLSVTKFGSWFQSVVDAALNTLPVENGKKYIEIVEKNNQKYITKKYHLSTKISGPANTLTICDNGNIIDVDLVPTFAFEIPRKPSFSKIDFTKMNSTNIKRYYVVPKPSENYYSWRLAFPEQERYYLRNKNNLKSSLKFLKLLRDTQGFQKLASYYIKTLFLCELTTKDDSFWKTNSVPYLTLYMMKRLRECLRIGKIPNFWCSDYNLIEKIKTETCQNWCNRLTNIIIDIEQKHKVNPYIWHEYLINKKKYS